VLGLSVDNVRKFAASDAATKKVLVRCELREYGMFFHEILEVKQ
jgi:hypothetical protein